jgi:hypothetical protein
MGGSVSLCCLSFPSFSSKVSIFESILLPGSFLLGICFTVQYRLFVDLALRVSPNQSDKRPLSHLSVVSQLISLI